MNSYAHFTDEETEREQGDVLRLGRVSVMMGAKCNRRWAGMLPPNSYDSPAPTKKASLSSCPWPGLVKNEKRLIPPCSIGSQGRECSVVISLERAEAVEGKPPGARPLPGPSVQLLTRVPRAGPPSSSTPSFVPKGSATSDNVSCVAVACREWSVSVPSRSLDVGPPPPS